MVRVPVAEPGTDYRREWDGTDGFMSQSTQTSLCLYCGVWYRWDEVHHMYGGGCYPPYKPVGRVRGETTYCVCGHNYESHMVWAEPDGVQDSLCEECAIQDRDNPEHFFEQNTER